MVKTQTLFGAVIAALLIGFIGGTVYSSFKLTPAGKMPARTGPGPVMPPEGAGGNAPSGINEAAAQEIFQLESYIKEHPDDAEAHARLGHLFFDSDQHQNAIEAYNRSLALEPDNPPVLTDLGVMYRRNGQPEKAVEAFDRAIQVDAGFEIAYFNKGIVMMHDLHDVDGGLNAWEALIQVNPAAMAPNGESVDAMIQRLKQR